MLQSREGSVHSFLLQATQFHLHSGCWAQCAWANTTELHNQFKIVEGWEKGDVNAQRYQSRCTASHRTPSTQNEDDWQTKHSLVFAGIKCLHSRPQWPACGRITTVLLAVLSGCLDRLSIPNLNSIRLSSELRMSIQCAKEKIPHQKIKIKKSWFQAQNYYTYCGNYLWAMCIRYKWNKKWNPCLDLGLPRYVLMHMQILENPPKCKSQTLLNPSILDEGYSLCSLIILPSTQRECVYSVSLFSVRWAWSR